MNLILKLERNQQSTLLRFIKKNLVNIGWERWELDKVGADEITEIIKYLRHSQQAANLAIEEDVEEEEEEAE